MSELSKLPLVVIDAKYKTYTRYVGKKYHVRAKSEGALLSADQVEQFRVNPSSMIDEPLASA